MRLHPSALRSGTTKRREFTLGQLAGIAIAILAVVGSIVSALINAGATP